MVTQMRKDSLQWSVLILCLILLVGAGGCRDQAAITPYQNLQQTKLSTLIGQTRETIGEMFLLSGQEREQDGWLTLPYGYEPYREGERWTYANWDMELSFETAPNTAFYDQRVEAVRLTSVHAGEEAYDAARSLFLSCYSAFRTEEEAATDGTPYADYVTNMKAALQEVGSSLEAAFRQENGAIALIRIEHRGAKTYRVTLEYRAENLSTYPVETVVIPKLISQEKVERQLARKSFANLLTIWGYPLLFIAIGVAVVFRQRIFARKRTARARLVQLNDDQDINARNFLAIPVGTIYQQRRMGSAATPMNEEFLNSRRLLFALPEEDDRLLSLRIRGTQAASLSVNQEYRITYKGSRLISIEQWPEGRQ